MKQNKWKDEKKSCQNAVELDPNFKLVKIYLDDVLTKQPAL